MRVALALIFCAGRLNADTVKLAGKPAFEQVEIVGFKQGRLVFRGVSGQTLQKPMEQVEWFARDRDVDLTAAEQRAALGQWPEAVAHYKKAQAGAGERWLREWIELRLLAALDGSGEFERAVEHYIAILHADPEREALAPPRRVGQPGGSGNQKARSQLIAAIETAPGAGTRATLRSFLLELVLYDDVEPLPAQLAIPEAILPARQRAVGGTKARRPRARYGLLPDRALYSDLPMLPANTVLLRGARDALARVEAGAAGEAGAEDGRLRLVARWLEGAAPFLDTVAKGEHAMLAARLMLAHGDIAAAASELTRLAESDPPAIACEALCYLALAQERAGQPLVARGVYDELLGRTDCPDAWTSRAKAGAARLK